MNFRLEPSDITVVVGTSKWNSGGIGILNSGGTAYNVETFIIHEQYNSSFMYDIGIMRMQEPITFTRYVKPIRYSAEVVPDDVDLEVKNMNFRFKNLID